MLEIRELRFFCISVTTHQRTRCNIPEELQLQGIELLFSARVSDIIYETVSRRDSHESIWCQDPKGK